MKQEREGCVWSRKLEFGVCGCPHQNVTVGVICRSIAVISVCIS